MCGADIALSYFFFNIDSAVCEKCGNRPFLAPSLHQCLDGLQSCNYVRDEVHRLTLHVLHWMSHVHATFGEVRRDAQDECGKRIRSLAENTLIWRATERDSVDSVRALVEQNTSIDFGMYQSMCTMLRRAMIGEVPFKDEHRMAAEFVASATKLIHVRQLSTRE